MILLAPRMLAAVAVEIVDLTEVAGRLAPVHLAFPGRAIGEFVGHFDDAPELPDILDEVVRSRPTQRSAEAPEL